MQLGEKLRQARQQVGLSQRQLCGEAITRNMLSQIENGSAHPSMGTLRYLAQQLDLPVSYFLEEESAVSANQACMEAAWSAFESGSPEDAWHHLEEYHANDPIFDRECRLLKSLLLLKLAEQCIAQNHAVQARQFLTQAEELEEFQSWLPELRERRICLMTKLGAEYTEDMVPNLDNSLFLRAEIAIREKRFARAAALLEAVSNRDTPRWCLLRGRAAFAEGEYESSVRFLQQAEAAFPSQAIPLLEQCFRELGDYKMAYTYACKGRSM